MLEKDIQLLKIDAATQIPSLDTLHQLPRGRLLKLIFSPPIESQRGEVGRYLKKELSGFKVGIHTLEAEINITKLITDEEIEVNQLFFEDCAKDYRKLSTELIYRLAAKLRVTIAPSFPLQTFNQLKGGKQNGVMDEWSYFIHGFHCGFNNQKTGQSIEVPLVFGLEFGDLDPYFFTNFINTTPDYKPLPVRLFEPYDDGVRINEKMLAIGKFEIISSSISNHFGIAVTDRNKIELETYWEEREKQKKFNIWKFFGFK
jgi:hypothetical protein